MPRFSKFVSISVGLLTAMALTAAPVSAAGTYGKERGARIYYPPPPGMTLTTGKPTNGLMLRVANPVHPQYLRQVVPYRTNERPGTIVVNTGQKFLYLVLPNGRALRYGIGVARSGFEWSGSHKLTAKRHWPGWTPPTEMRQRQPGLPAFMPGGPENPLGARALYIGSTLYRIHGTNQPWTIGGNVSSGCIRMTNDDVIDLYARVKIGTKVVVL